MRDLLLIKKVNPETEADNIVPITFQLDSKFSKKKAMEIFMSLKNNKIIGDDTFLIKNKTFTVSIPIKNTTKVIKEILDKDLEIYGVFIPYDDYLEKGCVDE